MSKLNGLFDPTTKKAVAIAVTIVLVFSVGYILGVVNNININHNGVPPVAAPVVAQNAPSNTTPNQAPAATPNEAPSQAPAETPSEAPSEAPSQAPSNDTPDPKPADKPQGNSSAPSTKAEILALYNKAANNVKTNAKKVTRNYQDLQHNEDKLVVPSALQSVGGPLISRFLKKDETPVEHTTKEAIIANFPVNGQTYSSKATEADLADAKCTDDGKYYNITLTFKECVDPVDTGAASAFTVIKQQEIYDAAGAIIKQASATYYDAVITCKIEKSTGNLVSANYKLPIILNVKAQVLVTLDAQVGMTFIDDFSIEY